MLRDIDKMAARQFSPTCVTCLAQMRDMGATAHVAQRLGLVGDGCGDGGIKRWSESWSWQSSHQDRESSATCATQFVAQRLLQSANLVLRNAVAWALPTQSRGKKSTFATCAT